MESQLTLFCEFFVKSDIEEIYFSLGILNDQNRPYIWVMSNDNNKKRFINIVKGKYQLSLKIQNHHLTPGVYIPNIAIRNADTGETYERILPDYSFKVKSDGDVLERGVVNVNEEWELNKINDVK